MKKGVVGFLGFGLFCVCGVGVCLGFLFVRFVSFSPWLVDFSVVLFICV